MPKLSIVILTFNSSGFIKACLDSVFSQDYQDFEVILVDNGSIDNTLSLVAQGYPAVRFISNKENLGAANARNQGIEVSKGEWVLTLDCDVVLERSFLAKIIDFAESSDESVGIFQPKILQRDKKRIYSCGAHLSRFRRFYDIGRDELDKGRFNKEGFVFGACCAAALYKKKMLEDTREDTGYFDQRFFFLVEDVDLAWRAQRKKWKTKFCPQAICYHAGGSSNVNNKIRQYFCFRNRYYLMIKNDGLKKFYLNLVFLSLYDLSRLFFIVFTNWGILNAIKEIPLFIKNRKKEKRDYLDTKRKYSEEDRLISIVIVGYNAGGHLSACLDSVYSQSYKNFEIIFVNNGSADETVSMLRLYPDVKIITNKDNKGFCFGNNQGIKATRGDYILTLNSDVVLGRDFLSELKNIASSDEAALFCPKILNKNGITIDSTGLALSRFYRFFDRGSGEIDIGQYNAKLDIFGPCAAAALYKKEALDDIRHNGEYFDEDFFFLGEDFDLAWRARKKKWKARFVPSAVCYHARNSTSFNSKFRQYLSFRNRCFLLTKNGSIGIKYFIVFLLYDIPRFIYMLMTNRYAIRAMYEVVRYRPKGIKQGAHKC